ncbi:MAG: endonuclease/exonuclease/phosphatase family protein [Anaerolineae bacterium]|nr:endonuclease/exonuclease/phosphatase family protein [Anaerolineae bacterium]
MFKIIDLSRYIPSFFKTGLKLSLLPIWAGLWLLGVGLILWYPLRWWPGDRLLPVRLINYFMPWLLVGLIPGIIIALLTRRYRLMMILAMPTLLISLTYAPLFLPRSPVALADNMPLTVMSYNVWGRNQNIASAIDVIREEQPDILLLQEVTWRTASALMAGLTYLYPDGELHTAFDPSTGQAIISRYPLTPLGPSFKKERTQKVLIETPMGAINVWNVHPYAPLVWRYQYQQISTLAKEIAAVDGPLIVGGDFNTTDQAETYRLVNQQLSNAHWEAGWGFGFSWPAHMPRVKRVPVVTPMVRIDHIFFSDHFFAHSAATLSISGGSDHLPVVAELSLVK